MTPFRLRDYEDSKELYFALKSLVGFYNADEPSVYFIEDHEGELSYIGMSRNIASRLATHLSGKWSKASRVYVQSVPDDVIEMLEMFCICDHRPYGNDVAAECFYDWLGSNDKVSERKWLQFVEDLDNKEEDLLECSRGYFRASTFCVDMELKCAYDPTPPGVYRCVWLANEISPNATKSFFKGMK